MATRFCVSCNSRLAPEERVCAVCGMCLTEIAVESETKGRENTNRRGQLRSLIRPRILAPMGVILLFLMGTLLSCQPKNPAPLSSVIPEDVNDAEGIPYPEVPRISVTDAKAKFDAHTTLFVDVRIQEEYDTAHIPNAVSIPLADVPPRYRELPRDRSVVAYCD